MTNKYHNKCPPGGAGRETPRPAGSYLAHTASPEAPLCGRATDGGLHGGVRRQEAERRRRGRAPLPRPAGWGDGGTLADGGVQGSGCGPPEGAPAAGVQGVGEGGARGAQGAEGGDGRCWGHGGVTAATTCEGDGQNKHTDVETAGLQRRASREGSGPPQIVLPKRSKVSPCNSFFNKVVLCCTLPNRVIVACGT